MHSDNSAMAGNINEGQEGALPSMLFVEPAQHIENVALLQRSPQRRYNFGSIAPLVLWSLGLLVLVAALLLGVSVAQSRIETAGQREPLLAA